jgi:ATP-binding protein involved in chromosome partitioning
MQFNQNSDPKFDDRMGKIHHTIMVLSGKGGVGKSSIAASLALSLSAEGAKVGLLDLDFHGPSIPTLFGVQGMPIQSDGENLFPLEAKGIKILSVGFLLDHQDSAVIWRGPMKIGMLKQFLRDAEWGELDYLIMDFPPGTGDEALSACQTVPNPAGAIIVTTPQEVSLADCRKSINFCRKMNLPILGVMENMNGFVCPKCGEVTPIFSTGGGKIMADKEDLEFLGSLPLDPLFTKGCDEGNISIETASPVTAGIQAAAKKIHNSL